MRKLQEIEDPNIKWSTPDGKSNLKAKEVCDECLCSTCMEMCCCEYCYKGDHIAFKCSEYTKDTYHDCDIKPEIDSVDIAKIKLHKEKE